MMNSLCQDVLLFRKWRVPIERRPNMWSAVVDYRYQCCEYQSSDNKCCQANVCRWNWIWLGRKTLNRVVNNSNFSDNNDNNHNKMNIFVDFISMSNPFIHEPIEELTKRNNSIWIQSIISKTYKKKEKIKHAKEGTKRAKKRDLIDVCECLRCLRSCVSFENSFELRLFSVLLEFLV